MKLSTNNEAISIAKNLISIADKVTPSQVVICIHRGTGEFTTYKDRIDGYKDGNIYFVFPNKYDAETKKYDMSNCKIYKNDAYNFRKSSDIDSSGSDLKYINNIKNLQEVYNVTSSKQSIDNRLASELTAREVICAILGNPISGTEWIDNMIRETNRIKLNN